VILAVGLPLAVFWIWFSGFAHLQANQELAGSAALAGPQQAWEYVRYLGIEVEDALEMSEETEIW